MDQTTITRRAALTTGGLFLGAGILGAAGPAPIVAAALSADIDHAEALLLELRDVMLRLDERHRFDVGCVLDAMSDAAGLAEPGSSAALAAIDDHVGPGKRVWDRMDRHAAATRRAFATHPAVVERYVDAYHAGGADAGTAIRADLAGTYGEELGEAIADAAFHLHLHRKYDHAGDPPNCERCWD